MNFSACSRALGYSKYSCGALCRVDKLTRSLTGINCGKQAHQPHCSRGTVARAAARKPTGQRLTHRVVGQLFSTLFFHDISLQFLTSKGNINRGASSLKVWLSVSLSVMSKLIIPSAQPRPLLGKIITYLLHLREIGAGCWLIFADFWRLPEEIAKNTRRLHSSLMRVPLIPQRESPNLGECSHQRVLAHQITES